MTSRLDRLFILLESGSSAVTRRAAAKQIGEVQKLYPHELHSLLNRLIGYLHSSSWETRIAAAQSVEAILANVPAWQPELYASIKKELKKEDQEEEDQTELTATSKQKFLTFAEFDLEQILQKGARLIGSEGIEFDFHDEEMQHPTTTAAAAAAAGNNGIAERLGRQRELLNEKLGLTQASKLGVNLMEMITDDDMIIQSTDSATSVNDEKVPVEQILKMKSSGNGKMSQLSCREMNRAKRKARQNMSSTGAAGAGATTVSGGSLSRRNSSSSTNSQASTSGGNSVNTNNNNINNGNSIEPLTKKMKVNTQQQEIFYSLNAPIPDATGNWIDAIGWPLENFCARLYVDLFNPKWEIRHGAATALRELIKFNSKGAGKRVDMTREEMIENHNKWLEDASLRLLCVLCLDRFGDFVSDQVVAPVRETVSQVLGTIVKDMPVEKVDQTVKLLVTLLKQSDWEVRHGGLLGLKYVFVVREDLLQLYLPATVNDILMGLFDAVDDVGAVAASTLIPVATWLPKLLNPLQVSSIVKMLWDLLLDQDELTSACNSFMGLLAAILSLPNASHWIHMEPMSTLIPRLWPFLSHSTSSVRKSTLLTLDTLTSITPERKANNENGKSEKSEILAPNNTTSVIATIVPSVNMNFDSKYLKLNLGVVDWPIPLLQEALRHIYQRILVEPQIDIQELAKKVWLNIVHHAELGPLLHAACPFVSTWICLAMQPPRLPFDSSMLISVSSSSSNSSNLNSEMSAHLSQRRRNQKFGDDSSSACLTITQKLYLGGSEAVPSEIRERNHTRARVTAARVLGALSYYLVQPAPGIAYTPQMETPTDCYTKVLLGHLNSRSAVQRVVCGLIIAFWAQSDTAMRPGCPKLQEKLNECVLEYVYYDEVGNLFTRLLQESHDLIATIKQYKVPIEDFNNAKILTLAQIESLATTVTMNALKACINLKPKIRDTLEERRKALLQNFHQTADEQSGYNISAQAALAGAIVCLHRLPEKLNPIVKPLMESIKREDCEMLQELSAEFLVHLMEQICDRTPSPNSKILTNLCTLLRSDAEFTPKIILPEISLKQTPLPKSSNNECLYYGILTLSLQQHTSNFGQRGNGTAVTAPRGPGRPPLNESLSTSSNSGVNENSGISAAEAKQCRVQRLGATCAITKLCQIFSESLIERIPIFKQLMFGKILDFVNTHESMDDALAEEIHELTQTNDMITSLQLFEIAAPHMHASLHESIFELLPQLGIVVKHPLKAVRHMAARCIATLATIDPSRTMDFVVNYLVKLLGNIENVIQRQGAVEAIERVVDKLQIRIVPYIVLLVVPLLGCMSDPDESVRLLSTHCFATLIQLMPLDSKSQNSNGDIKSTELLARKSRDREFLDYLFKPKTIPDYKVPVSISVELRSYQQAGVNWLWFLNKYKLHGILCDDMGLGKTLQTICILAGDHYQRQAEKVTSLPSLVICPPTLTGHWVYEIEKFLEKSSILRPLHYVGLPIGREKLRCLIGKRCNLVVASYDTIRKDIDFFGSVHWNYCVLDEGHIIKNGKTKSSRAIKTLKAQHRLILSGTPIQNNVLELWSLFDFLMPGFLGTEKQFIARYSRPILASRDSKSSSKDQEAGVLAMESLHRQVLPFLLRRVKEDVLTDLPPKITQDLLCELSPLQERLYEDFSKSHLNTDIKDCLEQLSETENINSKTHIFHALRYLQNVCNHPKLVLNPKHPEYSRILEELQLQQSSLNDIEHSAKLPALKQLLLDCGIGVQTETVSQHRALIFCQLKAMLDIVEKDLLRKHLPSVTYLRLDGSVPASLRQDIVNNFNSDPSIDVLLLTTQVGGLGLNLTGADTVIFVEHDWNPMKDLQAMDRAHRIGQKKVVNVYRLITRKSLEEKIMGLQKFKILTANTVVSSENASMETMATEQIFDLFTLQEQKNGNAATSSTNTGGRSHVSVNTIIETLPELWSENQYDEEYDVNNFMHGLKK